MTLDYRDARNHADATASPPSRARSLVDSERVSSLVPGTLPLRTTNRSTPERVLGSCSGLAKRKRERLVSRRPSPTHCWRSPSQVPQRSDRGCCHVVPDRGVGVGALWRVVDTHIWHSELAHAVLARLFYRRYPTEEDVRVGDYFRR
jgi:hypothetical protein